MSTDNRWRDSWGFTRPEGSDRTAWSINGPDGEDHSLGCMFVQKKGAQECTCDRTRRFPSEWVKRHTVWVQTMMWNTVPEGMSKPFKWPVTGPDGDPWVPGVDFNDD